MDKIKKIKDWLKPYLEKDKIRDEHGEGFFHCAMLLNDFIDTLLEESDKSLDEAAQKVEDYYDVGEEYGHLCCYRGDIKGAFIAGAEWQKRKMMEEAVEGYVTLTLTGVLTVAATIKEGDNIGIGDKVRIIIVKGD